MVNIETRNNQYSDRIKALLAAKRRVEGSSHGVENGIVADAINALSCARKEGSELRGYGKSLLRVASVELARMVQEGKRLETRHMMGIDGLSRWSVSFSYGCDSVEVNNKKGKLYFATALNSGKSIDISMLLEHGSGELLDVEFHGSGWLHRESFEEGLSVEDSMAVFGKYKKILIQ